MTSALLELHCIDVSTKTSWSRVHFHTKNTLSYKNHQKFTFIKMSQTSLSQKHVKVHHHTKTSNVHLHTRTSKVHFHFHFQLEHIGKDKHASDRAREHITGLPKPADCSVCCLHALASLWTRMTLISINNYQIPRKLRHGTNGKKRRWYVPLRGIMMTYRNYRNHRKQRRQLKRQADTQTEGQSK